MKILVRNEDINNWELVKSYSYDNEAELQKLLSESPDLIPANDMREGSGDLVAAVREFNVSIGSIDLLAFSGDGDIAVIECKLASNPEVKRKVIGQVLEYGSAIWGMDYEDLDQGIRDRTNKSLADFVGSEISDPEWDEELFRSNIEKHLEDGNFILVIVVDEINDELSKIIRFLNACGNPRFSFTALEMRRFHTKSLEILVPKVDGDYRSPTTRETTGRRTWDESSLFADARKKLNEYSLRIYRELFEFSKKYSHGGIEYGTGYKKGSFSFYYENHGKRKSVFSAYSNGDFSINFGFFSQIFGDKTVKDFAENLAKIPAFSDVLDDDQYYYTKKLETFFEEPKYLDDFKKAVVQLGETFKH